MDTEAEWVFVEDEDDLVIELNTASIYDETNENNPDETNKCSYAAALLTNIQQNHQQQQSALSIKQKKEKRDSKQDKKRELMVPYIEPKPGSQYRNPRDKAGQNKVHKGRRRSSSPPKNLGNSLKVGCSFCNPKLSNRVQRQRNIRQQCSAAKWKDYDY